jgi:hypothetical protein
MLDELVQSLVDKAGALEMATEIVTEIGIEIGTA